jgi:hypothetical protein
LNKYVLVYILASVNNHSSYHSYLLPVNLPGKIIIRAGSISRSIEIFGLKPKENAKEFALSARAERVFLYLSEGCCSKLLNIEQMNTEHGTDEV